MAIQLATQSQYPPLSGQESPLKQQWNADFSREEWKRLHMTGQKTTSGRFLCQPAPQSFHWPLTEIVQPAN